MGPIRVEISENHSTTRIPPCKHSKTDQENENPDVKNLSHKYIMVSEVHFWEKDIHRSDSLPKHWTMQTIVTYINHRVQISAEKNIPIIPNQEVFYKIFSYSEGIFVTLRP